MIFSLWSCILILAPFEELYGVLKPVFLSCPRIKEIGRPQISIQWWLLSLYQTRGAAKKPGMYRECCEDKNPLYSVGPRPPVPRPRLCLSDWPPGPTLDHIADIVSLDTVSPGMTTLNKELRHPHDPHCLWWHHMCHVTWDVFPVSSNSQHVSDQGLSVIRANDKCVLSH